MSFGPLYVALQTSTNQNPSSISGYWKQISAAASFAPEAYFQSPQYRFANSGAGLWTTTDTYNPGDIIGMAMTGHYDQLTAFDVPTNAATFSHVPVYLATCSNGSDPVIDAENTAAYNALSAVNPNVSIARVTTTCSHVGEIFAAVSWTAWADQYRVSLPTKQTPEFGTQPAPYVAIARISAVCDTAKCTFHHYKLSDSTQIPVFSWSVLPWQNFTIDCHLIWRHCRSSGISYPTFTLTTVNANANTVNTAAGGPPRYAQTAANTVQNLLPTNFNVATPWTFTTSETGGLQNTDLTADIKGSYSQGNIPGTLTLSFGTSQYAVSVRVGSYCGLICNYRAQIIVR